MERCAEVRLFFEQLAEHWDAAVKAEQQSQLKKIFTDQIPALLPPILDLGSGTGALFPFLQKKMKGYGNIVQLDVAGRMLKIARLKWGYKKDLHFVQGDAANLPFAAASFGTVFCFQVVPHIADKQIMLQNIRRILYPGGYLVVLHLSDHFRLNALHRRLSHPIDTHEMCSAEELAAMMAASGLRILRVTEKTDLYLVVATRPDV